MSQSYHSASSSMDKVRLASRLENETKELAKKVKESSVMKSYKDQKGFSAYVAVTGTTGAAVRGSIDTSKSSDENRNIKSPLSISQLVGTPPTADMAKGK